MSKYTLGLSRATKKFLDKSDKVTKKRVIKAIQALTEDPYSYLGSIRLTGFENTYRIRVGKYRIIYQVLDQKLIIFIQDIDSRDDIYKHL